MGFQHGVSGLNAASKNLDVIGNNVANANTVGFKQSQAQFADVYASSLGGAANTQIGSGVKLATVAQQFQQGNITATSNTMDMAINGQGFFRMDNNGALSYTRNGQFQLDKDGFIVNSSGHKLTGFAADSAGAIITAAPGPLQIPTADLTPQASSSVLVGLNLDASSAVPATAVFNATDPTSFNNSTSTTVYDSLGNSHIATLYFQKDAVANNWNAFMTIDNQPAAGISLGALTFSSAGVVTAPAGPPVGTVSASVTYANGATSPQTMALDFSTTTQFGSPFGVNKLSQDGFTSGRLSGFVTGDDGVIVGRYTNGQSRALGQVALANFSNPQGLLPLDGNEWGETFGSGSPLVGGPNTGSLGTLQSSSVEDSNVDLTAELVNMITAQRNFQANAQTIKTVDSLMQTLVTMR